MGLICNAGVNVANVLWDGTVTVCRDRREPLGNIYTGFQFREQLVDCDYAVCQCPLWSFDKRLHAKAKGELTEDIGYDAFLHWYVTLSCNFLCRYCIVEGTKKEDTLSKLKPADPINIPAMMDTLEKTGKTFSISFIGGEPFSVPNLPEACAALTEKHNVSFNTNALLIPERFFKIVNFKRLGVMHISFHPEEIERRSSLMHFVDKIKMMKSYGYEDFFITTVADPKVFPKLQFYQDLFKEHGLEFKLIPMIEGGGLYGKPYPESYTEEELKMMKRDWLEDYFPQKSAEKANSGQSGLHSSSCKTVYQID